MADDQIPTQDEGGDGTTAREVFDQLSGEAKKKLLGGDKVEALTEEEIAARLSGLDSGDTLGHDDLVQGMANELSAQSRVIDQLSAQVEEESLNIAKVLDSSKINLEFLMEKRIKEPTKTIIGPTADKERRANIQNEINLPNATAYKMCIKSIFIRIGRVAITASGIFLGIAFYASVQMTAKIQDATRIQEERRLGEDATATGGEANALDLEKEQQIAQEKARTTWLIVMALMVSVVGICNSMLMAVTERFQEIGTMKCLGALDQFIVKLFLIESGILGALAGITGSLVGVLGMYVVNVFRYDFRFGDVWMGMLSILAWSLTLGTVLSIMAAIMPARQAAKMPAAAALRTTV